MKETKTTRLNRELTSYPVRMNNELLKLHDLYKSEYKGILKFYQYMLRYIYTDPFFGLGTHNHHRGILIYHETGSGKTLSGANIAMALADNHKIIIFVNRSIRENFDREFAVLFSNIETDVKNKIQTNIKYITIDAYNSATQLKNFGTLDNAVIIIDEAHNFFKSIVSGAEDTNAKKIYDMIMNTHDLKLVFMSGTPIAKDPFELVACMNMLSGVELLPTDYDIFYKTFVSNGKVHNKETLQNRLFGLVSYISYEKSSIINEDDENAATVPDAPRSDGAYPEDMGINVVRVEMSKVQYTRYLLMREEEDSQFSKYKNTKYKRVTKPMSQPSSSKGMSTYYVKSRMASNFAPPLDMSSGMDDSVFSPENSPKIIKLLDNIDNSNGLSIVYSQFVHNGGLEIVSKYMKLNGWEEANVTDNYMILPPKKRYIIISGNVLPQNRTILQDIYNRAENMYGDIIKVAMISKVGAEGLNFKCVRYVHILEPYWYWSKIEQIKARGIRKGSHDRLPHAERDVTTYLYVAVENEEVKSQIKKIEDRTIDDVFYLSSVKKYKLIREFLEMLKDISIECLVTGRKTCRLCEPTNEKLYKYPNDAIMDIKLIDPCILIKSNKISAESITVNNVEYMYVSNPNASLGYSVYIYDDKLRGHVEIPQSSEEYMTVIKNILKLS